MEPFYLSVIRLTLKSSYSVASRASGMRRGRGFICTRAVPRGRERARGGGCGDAAPGSGNDFVPY